MSAAAKASTLIPPTRGHPATILVYAFLQSLGAGITVLPTLFLFRNIARKECRSLTSSESDPCNAIPVYTPPVIVYLSIVFVLGLLVTGPTSKLVDAKGRKAVMVGIGLLHSTGNIWLHTCASVPFLTSNFYIPSIASIFHGLGGAAIIAQVLQWEYIADTAAPEQRSTYLSLNLFANFAGAGVGQIISGLIVEAEQLPVAFMLGFWAWIAYALLAAGVLREAHTPSSSNTDTASSYLASIIRPIVLILQHPTLKLLALAYVALWLGGMGAFSPLFSLAISRFGLSSVGMILPSVLSPVMQGLIYLITPFIVKVVYRCIGKPGVENAKSKDEQTSLLFRGSKSRNAVAETVPAAWRREVSITSFAFTAGLGGVTYALLSHTVPHYTMGSAIATLCIPGVSSIVALVTLQADVAKMGQILSGFALIDKVILNVRYLYAISHVSDAVEGPPSTPLVMFYVACLLGGCILSRSLLPTQRKFTSKS